MILFTLLIILTIFCLYRSIQPIYIYSTKEYYSSIISKRDYYIYKSMYNINIINNSDNTRSILHYKRNNNKKAIFWISGYCDYYYHYHIGELFNNNGYDIFAISLRRCADANITDNLYNYSNNFNEYLEDINKQLKYIKSKYKYEKIILHGFSNGGLISTYYMHRYPNSFDGLILHSPFFDFKTKKINRLFGLYILYYIGLIFPYFILRYQNKNKTNFTNNQIIKRFYMNPKYKSDMPNMIYAAFISEVINIQTKIHNKEVNIEKPILSIFCDKTVGKKEINGENLLKIEDMEKYSDYIGENVTKIKIKNGAHDLYTVQHYEETFYKVLNWLNKNDL